jgi:murein DD-endopeptidase MepM/ murein hydrolase activator NlpD
VRAKPLLNGLFRVVGGLPLAVAACVTPDLPIHDLVSSPYGLRWGGILPEVHSGADIRALEGTPVRAMTSGRVRFAGVMEGYGNVVWIDHAGKVISVYAHLSQIYVSAGSEIERQDIIGLSGSTGTATGPHLHFEVWKHGRPVDPIHYLGRRP